MATDETQLAFFRTMARQLSPFIREMLTDFAERHSVNFHNTYITLRFRNETDLENSDNSIMELRIIGKPDIIEDHLELMRNSPELEESDMKLIQSLLPMFSLDTKEHATYLGVPVTSMFVMIRVMPGAGGKVDNARIKLKCSMKKGWDYPILDSENFEI